MEPQGLTPVPMPIAPPQPIPAQQPLPQQPLPTQVQQPEVRENIYTEICAQIIKEQSRIIGLDLALQQASNVEGLTVNTTTFHCDVVGDGSKVINDLIEQYRDFFGHAAVEVCREAASRFLVNLPTEQTPTLLK